MEIPDADCVIKVKINEEKVEKVEPPAMCIGCKILMSRPCHLCSQPTNLCLGCNLNATMHRCKKPIAPPSDETDLRILGYQQRLASLEGKIRDMDFLTRNQEIIDEILNDVRKTHEQEKETLRGKIEKLHQEIVAQAKKHKADICRMIAEHEDTVRILKTQMADLTGTDVVDLEKKITQLRGLPKMKRGGLRPPPKIVEQEDKQLLEQLTTGESNHVEEQSGN
jgi:hypothetical protein